MKLTLEYPITHAGETIKEVEFKRPKAGDLMHLSISKMEDWTGADLLPVLISCTGLEAPVFTSLMDARDFVLCQEAIANFIMSGPEDGPTSSPDSPDSSDGDD